MEIGLIILGAAPKVVGQGHPEPVMVPAQEVVAETLTGREVPDVPVVRVEDRAAADLHRARAVVDGLDVGGGPGDEPPLRQVRIEQARQDDAAGVLPFLQWRWRLGQ